VADEALAPVEGEPGGETVSAEDVVAEPESETVTSEPDPIAQLAAEMGWKPKEEYQGDNWKPAAEFIKAGRDITQTVSRQLRTVQEELGRVTRTSAQLMADKLAERDAYWANIQAQGVEDGKQDVVDRAVRERIKLQQSAPVDTPPPPPPESLAFMERHKNWYGVDPLATMRAEEITAALFARGVSVPEQLKQVERAIRKEYPELFVPTAKQPAAVQTATSRNANTSSRQKGFADMPAESQKLAREYQAQHGIPVEKFAASYWQDQENQRRVG
jgi:hypothetical protein